MMRSISIARGTPPVVTRVLNEQMKASLGLLGVTWIGLVRRCYTQMYSNMMDVGLLPRYGRIPRRMDDGGASTSPREDHRRSGHLALRL